MLRFMDTQEDEEINICLEDGWLILSPDKR